MRKPQAAARTPATPKVVQLATPAPAPAPAPTPSPSESPPPPAPAEPPAVCSLLSPVQWRAFTSAASSRERFDLLAQALGVLHPDTNPRTSIWLAFCFGVLDFAVDEVKWGELQTLLLLQVAHDVYTFATTPIDSQFPSLDAVYDAFRARIRSCSVGSSEASSRVRFEPDDVTSIVGFLTATFFRHLGAYQLVHRALRPSYLHQVQLVVESPMPPMPLSLALRPEEHSSSA